MGNLQQNLSDVSPTQWCQRQGWCAILWLPEKPPKPWPARLYAQARRAIHGRQEERGRIPAVALLHVDDAKGLARVEFVDELP